MNKSQLQPAANLTEQFNLLKYRVLGMLNGKANQPVTIAFTSCEPGEGVSTIAANFTLALAEESKFKLLLVEANLQRPSLGRLFGEGMAEPTPQKEAKPTAEERQLLTVNGRKMVRAHTNLDLITVDEKIGRHNGPAFNLTGLTHFLEKAKEQYDLVILDRPSDPSAAFPFQFPPGIRRATANPAAARPA